MKFIFSRFVSFGRFWRLPRFGRLRGRVSTVFTSLLAVFVAICEPRCVRTNLTSNIGQKSGSMSIFVDEDSDCEMLEVDDLMSEMVSDRCRRRNR